MPFDPITGGIETFVLARNVTVTAFLETAGPGQRREESG